MNVEATNPTQLDLSFTLPAVQGFDYAGLKSWAEGIKAKYADVVVMEEQIAGAKAEMAELNRIKKQLDAARIAAVKKVSEPIKEFEAQVKEVCGIFQETYDFLGGQVKGYEERAREEKRQQVLFAIETLTAEAGYPGLEIPVQDSWLNKTQKDKQTAAEIKAIIADHIKAERDAAALEQAKQDRAVAIEQHSAAQAQAFGFNIPPSQFLALQDLAIPLGDVLTRINAAYTLKAQTAPSAPPAAPVAAPPPAPAHPQAQATLTPPSASTASKSMDIRIEFEATNEDAVRMALRHLKTLCTAMALNGPEHMFLAGAPLAAQAPRVRNY